MQNKKSEEKNSLKKTEERLSEIVENVLSHSDASQEEKEWWKKWYNRLFFKPTESTNNKS